MITESPPPVSNSKKITRSTSFKTAVKVKPLRSNDFDNEEEIEQIGSQSDKTIRSRSFRIATKLQPLGSLDLPDDSVSLSNPTTPSVSSRNSGFDSSDLQDVFDGRDSGMGGSTSTMDSAITLDQPTITKPSSLRLSSDAFKSLRQSQPSAKILDAKQYFMSLAGDIKHIAHVSSLHNLRRDSNSPTAFHNTIAKRIVDSPKLETRNITLTRPLALSSMLKGTQSNQQLSACDREDECSPWIKYKNTRQVPMRQRSRSTDNDLESDLRSQNMNWIVYANRNSLPAGYSTDDIPRLYKQCSPNANNSKVSQSTDNVFGGESRPTSLHGQSIQRHSMSVAENVFHSPQMSEAMKKFNDSVDMLASMTSLDEKKEETKDILTNIPSRFDNYTERRTGKLTRSNSTPCATLGAKLRQEKGIPSVRSASVDMDSIIVDHEQIVAEMEEYLMKSDPQLLENLNGNKFPIACPQVVSDDEMDMKRDSCLSNGSSSSSYDSNTDEEANNNHDSYLEPGIDSVSHRRSGSYDNKLSDEHLDLVPQHSTQESKTSLLSLNSWFTNKKKESDEPDLHSILHQGDLGGTVIGGRIADPESIYNLPGKRLSVSRENLFESSSTNDYEEIHFDKNTNNLNHQQSDSALSIRDDCISEDSPQRAEKGDNQSRSNSLSSAESFYEKRLSLVFDENDAFRDSAVYCEMDNDSAPGSRVVSPKTSFESKPLPLPLSLHVSQTVSPIKPARLPIKDYVQKLEKDFLPSPVQTTKISQKEPSDLIRQRMLKLQYNAEYRSRSRPVSEERELFNHAERDMRYIDLTSKDSTSYLSRDSVKYSRSRSLGSTSSQMSHSLGHLDTLSDEVDNTSIMTGWVKSLVQKFQTPSSSNG